MMDDFHNLYYQGLSDDVHANIESLNHYFDEASAHFVNFGPSDKGLSEVAAACERTMLSLIETYAQYFSQAVSEELLSLSRRIDDIEQSE
jgi:hypothetical protein